jgi:hypothetical protein
MYSVRRTGVLPPVGFPIRASADHRPFSAYSRLIAAVHALHRLLVPRHPPCALDILTVILIDLAEHRPKDKPVLPNATPRPRRPKTTKPRAGPVVRCGIRCWMTVQFSRSDKRAPVGGLPTVGLSKLNSMQALAWCPSGPPKRPHRIGARCATSSSVDVRNLLEECRPRYCDRWFETGAPILELPRKEVIQPHLPVRLPCYDFTPVTGPTFDGSLPEG